MISVSPVFPRLKTLAFQGRIARTPVDKLRTLICRLCKRTTSNRRQCSRSRAKTTSYSNIRRARIQRLCMFNSVCRTLGRGGEVSQVFFVQHKLLKRSEPVDLLHRGQRRVDLGEKFMIQQSASSSTTSCGSGRKVHDATHDATHDTGLWTAPQLPGVLKASRKPRRIQRSASSWTTSCGSGSKT